MYSFFASSFAEQAQLRNQAQAAEQLLSAVIQRPSKQRLNPFNQLYIRPGIKVTLNLVCQ
jgi:hypothetical protein